MARRTKSEFDELEKEIRKGMDPRKTKRLERKAVDWFLGKVGKQQSWKNRRKKWDDSKERKDFGPADYMRGKQGIKKDPIAGQMFTYWYDAKHKDTLPYFDRFPMMMPIELYDDGMLGLNLHYLPPFMRARLLGLIMNTMNSKKLSREAKAKINYGLIKESSKYAIAQPCIKRYLTSHIQSKIVRVHPQEWEDAIMLPIDAFTGADRRKVWKDSMEELKK